MPRRALALPLLLLLTAAASGPRKITRIEDLSLTGYDEFFLLGWNDACSVAFQYYSYPPVGDGLQGLPDAWQIGTLTIPPGRSEPFAEWSYASTDGGSWVDEGGKAAADRLQRLGYTRAGFVEVVRDAPVSPRPGLAEVILTTASLKLERGTKLPPARYKLRQVYYNPLVTCALLVFRDPSTPRDSHQMKLVRLPDPTVRRARAKAHLDNGLLFYQAADIYNGVAELGVAAGMDPGYALARYHHAALLATHGRFDETLKELDAAFRLEPDYKRKARKAIEFESLRKDPRFIALLKR